MTVKERREQFYKKYNFFNSWEDKDAVYHKKNVEDFNDKDMLQSFMNDIGGSLYREWTTIASITPLSNEIIFSQVEGLPEGMWLSCLASKLLRNDAMYYIRDDYFPGNEEEMRAMVNEIFDFLYMNNFFENMV